jgi:hypothetical protein
VITLTTPAQINTVLGGNAPVPYNKLVLAPFTMDGVQKTISGRLRLTSTSSQNMQAILGTLTINTVTFEFVLEVPQLDFYRRIVLSAGQVTAVLAIVETAQASLEQGLVDLGVIAGVRSAGA